MANEKIYLPTINNSQYFWAVTAHCLEIERESDFGG